jgi:hypothetical protein
VRERLLTILLIVQICILFVIPAARLLGLRVPRSATDAALLLFVVLAISISRRRAAMLTMALAVALTISASLLHHARPDLATDVTAAVAQVLTQVSLLWVVGTAVFGPGRITHHRIVGAVVMYLAIGMMFISLDTLAARTLPGAFTHLPTDPFELREAMTYFSFGVLTTCSFGDITPLHPVVRSLANVESICGQLYPATLLARIVGLHANRPWSLVAVTRPTTQP